MKILFYQDMASCSYSVFFLILCAAFNCKAALGIFKGQRILLATNDPSLEIFQPMIRKAGSLKYTVHEFTFHALMPWSVFFKKFKAENRGRFLDSISKSDIDNIFKDIDFGSIKDIKNFVFTFEVRGRELFCRKSKWKVDDGIIDRPINTKKDTIVCNAEYMHIRENDKNGVPKLDLELHLGPPYEVLKGVVLSNFKTGEQTGQETGDLILTNPIIKIGAEDDYETITYQIPASVLSSWNHYPKSGGNKADEIFNNLASYYLNKTTEMGVYVPANLGISYNSQEMHVSTRDYGLQALISRHTQVVDTYTVKVDIFSALKTAILSPSVLFQFNKNGKLQNNHKEWNATRQQKVPFMHIEGEGDFFPGHNFNANHDVDPVLEAWISKRMNNVAHIINDEGIDDNNEENIRIMMKKMMREDAKKFRLTKNITFHANDEHFAAKSKYVYDNMAKVVGLFNLSSTD